jgi:hypothetical protein
MKPYFLSLKEKIKKGISVKKFPVFSGLRSLMRCKFQIPKGFFADSRA